MSHKSPNHLQVVLLYDNPDTLDLRDMMAIFQSGEALDPGHSYNIVEYDEKAYFRLFGGRDIMVFVEKIGRQADRTKFKPALGSVFNNIATPDAAALIDRHRACADQRA